MPAATINLDDNPDTTGTTDSSTSTAPPRTPSIAKLEGQLRDFYSQFGTFAAMTSPDPFVGAVVQGNAEVLAAAWADLAAQDPKVKQTLERILSGGTWAAVVGGHLAGIVAPILAYYGKLPAAAQNVILMGMWQQHNAPDGNPVIAQCLAQRFAPAAETP